MLEVRDLCVTIGTHRILENVSFHVKEGQWMMVVGPNGAGKTTLLNAITQGIGSTGTILLRGQDIRRMSSRQIARQVGVLAQRHFTGYAFTVEEVVRMGRYAHRRGFFRPGDDADETAVREAIRQCGLEELRSHSVLTLSGGELQRTFLAQAFCQEPSLLLLDEPANHLDIGYQKQVFERIREWLNVPGRAVISVVHDLSLAKIHATDALLLQQGRTAGRGPAREVLRAELLNRVYGMDVTQWMREMYLPWQEDETRPGSG